MIEFTSPNLPYEIDNNKINEFTNLRNLRKSFSVKKQVDNLSNDFPEAFNYKDSEKLKSKINIIINNEKNKTTSTKFYMIQKLDLTNKVELKEIINKQFTDPNNFLKADENIKIGKNALGESNFKDLNKIKPYHIIGDPNLFEPKRKFSFFRKVTAINNNNNDKKKKIKDPKSVFSRLLSNIIFTKQQKVEEIDIEILSDNNIKRLFEAKEKLVLENTKKEDELYYNIEEKCQTEVKSILQKQENLLNKRTKCEKEISNLSKYLSFKTQKPENKLLMNRTEGFRLKNEIKTKINEKDSKQTKYGFQNDWAISLRKSPGKNPLYGSENRYIRTTNEFKADSVLINDFNPLKTVGVDFSSTQSNFNKSGNNFFKYNFKNSSDNKFNYLKYHKSHDNDMWVTIKEDVDPDDCIKNKFLNFDQVRKPNTDPISILDNFTRCQSVEKKFQNLKIKKEDFSRINNMKVKIISNKF